EAPARVSLWEEPTVISGIEGNRRLKYSLLTGGAILALGLGLVTFLEYRNRRVVTTQDASANLGLRLIGTVPSMPRLIERPDGSSTVRAALWRSMLTEH